MDYRDQTIGDLLAEIASKTISPAGGSAVATTGALGAALCEMAYIHVLNDHSGDAPVSELERNRSQLSAQREALLRLAEADTQVVQEAFEGPRFEADDSDLKRALGVPLAIAEACLTVLETAERTNEWRDRAVAADANTGVLLAEGALRSALFIVEQNLELVSDQSYIDDTRERAAEIRGAAERMGRSGDMGGNGEADSD